MRLLLTASVVQVPLSHQGKLVVDHNLWLITSKCRGACNQAWPDALLGGSPAPGRGGPVESLPTAWQPGARPGPWAGAGSPPFSLSSTGTGVDLHTYPIPLYPIPYTLCTIHTRFAGEPAIHPHETEILITGPAPRSIPSRQTSEVFSGAGFWRTATRTGLPEPSKRALNFCQTDFSLTPTIPD